MGRPGTSFHEWKIYTRLTPVASPSTARTSLIPSSHFEVVRRISATRATPAKMRSRRASCASGEKGTGGLGGRGDENTIVNYTQNQARSRQRTERYSGGDRSGRDLARSDEHRAEMEATRKRFQRFPSDSALFDMIEAGPARFTLPPTSTGWIQRQFVDISRTAGRLTGNSRLGGCATAMAMIGWG